MLQYAHTTPEGNKPCKTEPKLYKNFEDAHKALQEKLDELEKKEK